MVSVTKLISILDKPALKYWANKIGLEGVDLRNYEPMVQHKGNSIHNNIELFVKEGVDFEDSDLFLKQIKGFEILACESNCDNGYINGRIDLLLSKNNMKYVVDIKSSKHIYLSTKLQLSAYKEILKADYIMYMDSKTFELKQINIDTSKYFNIIKNLYRIHLLLKELNERL